MKGQQDTLILGAKTMKWSQGEDQQEQQTPVAIPKEGITIKALLHGLNSYLEYVTSGQVPQMDNIPSPSYTYTEWTPFFGTSLEAIAARSLTTTMAGELGAAARGCLSCGKNDYFTNKDAVISQDQANQIIQNLVQKEGFQTLSTDNPKAPAVAKSIAFEIQKAAEAYPKQEPAAQTTFADKLAPRAASFAGQEAERAKLQQGRSASFG